MANRLKDIFSDQIPDVGARVQFRDQQSKEAFLEKLERVFNDGTTESIDGVTGIRTDLRIGGMVYPQHIGKPVDKLQVGPSVRSVPMTVQTPYGEKTVTFGQYSTKAGNVLETGKDGITELKLVFAEGSSTFHFSYRFHLERAGSVDDVIDSLSTTLGILERLFRLNDEQEAADIIGMKWSMQATLLFFEKLKTLEQTLSLRFDPTAVGEIDDEMQDVAELCFLLAEGKAVRLNAKLKQTREAGVTLLPNAEKLRVGAEICLVFQNEAVYSVCGQEVHVYRANLLSDAVIKDISEGEDGKTTVRYGDDDSRPMYISYTGFLTEEAAKEELKKVMDRKAVYAGALTVKDQLQQEMAEKHII